MAKQNKNLKESEIVTLVKKEQNAFKEQAQTIINVMGVHLFTIEQFRKRMVIPSTVPNGSSKKISWSEARFILSRLEENGLAVTEPNIKDAYQVTLDFNTRLYKYKERINKLQEESGLLETCIDVIVEEQMALKLEGEKEIINKENGGSEKPKKSSKINKQKKSNDKK